MKPFYEIIKEISLSTGKNVRKLLKTYGMLEIIQSTYSLLKSGSCKPEEHLNIGNLVSNFLTVTSSKISSIQNSERKSEMEFLLINISENILLEYLIVNKCQQQIIIPQIVGAIRTTCRQCKYKFGPYEKLLVYIVNKLPKGFDKKGNSISKKNDNGANCNTIQWLNGNLYELVDILKNENYINRKEELFAFFKSSEKRSVVKINPEKKYHMAYLLNRLFNENFAHIKRNRGYFRCAEMMFADLEGKPYKLHSLKKISSRINKDKAKYLYVTKEIDNIIKKISNGTNGR